MQIPKIYVDSCCFIESLKGADSDPARASGLDIMRRLMTAARDDKVVIYTSMLTVAEVIKAGDAEISDDLKRKIERLILSGRDGITTVALSPSIVLKARDLAWNDGLSAVKAGDRLHLASAIVAGAKEFISWDNRLGKKVNRIALAGLKLIDPASTILLPNEYRADDMFSDKR